MAVLKPRERLVYFRITEDEFHQFAGVCEQAGARSISDLARNAVQRLITEGRREQQDHDFTPKIQSLERLIAEVTAQLQMLTTLRAATALSERNGNSGAPARTSGTEPACDDHNVKE